MRPRIGVPNSLPARASGVVLACGIAVGCAGLPPAAPRSLPTARSEEPAAGAAAAPAPVPCRFLERAALVPSMPAMRASLCLPQSPTGAAGTARPPAALLIGGWGVQDRDGTVGPNKPLRDLAWGLACRGIAVLRFVPPRTLTSEDRNADAPTLDAVMVEPALAAAGWLLSQPEVDGQRVVAIGHSMGGLAVTRMAEREPRLAGLVLMATATRPFEQVLVDQLRHVAALDGVTTEREQALLDRLVAQAERATAVRNGLPGPTGDLPLGLPAAFWLDLSAKPPGSALGEDPRPVLVLHGGHDYQATDQDFAGWKQLLSKHPRASFRRYEGLNHLFMPATGASSPTEYRIPGHVSPLVVAELADWIAKLPARADAVDRAGAQDRPASPRRSAGAARPFVVPIDA